MRLRHSIVALCLLLAGAVSALAQGSNGGILFASDFGQWSLPGQQPANGTIVFTPGSVCRVSSNGYNFNAPAVGRPLKIVDTIPGHTETVIPTAVNITSQNCAISAPMTYQHLNYYVVSGTGGLWEALTYPNLNDVEMISTTPEWSRLGGVTSMITGAPGSSLRSILDERTSDLCSYEWTGSAYATSGCLDGSGGSGVTHLEGPLVQDNLVIGNGGGDIKTDTAAFTDGNGDITAVSEILTRGTGLTENVGGIATAGTPGDALGLDANGIDFVDAGFMVHGPNQNFYVGDFTSRVGTPKCTVNSVVYTTDTNCTHANAKAWTVANQQGSNVILKAGTNNVNLPLSAPMLSNGSGAITPSVGILAGLGPYSSYLNVIASLPAGVAVVTGDTTTGDLRSAQFEGFKIFANGLADACMDIIGFALTPVKHIDCQGVRNSPTAHANHAYAFGLHNGTQGSGDFIIDDIRYEGSGGTAGHSREPDSFCDPVGGTCPGITVGQVVQSVAVTNPGSGGTPGNYFFTMNGGGVNTTNAVGSIFITWGGSFSGACPQSFNIHNDGVAGSGAAATPVCTLSGSTYSITGYSGFTGGSGYTGPPIVDPVCSSPCAVVANTAPALIGANLLPVGGQQAQGAYTIGVGGGITGNITLTNNGAAYTSTPTIPLLGGLTGATFTVNMTSAASGFYNYGNSATNTLIPYGNMGGSLGPAGYNLQNNLYVSTTAYPYGAAVVYVQPAGQPLTAFPTAYQCTNPAGCIANQEPDVSPAYWTSMMMSEPTPIWNGNGSLTGATVNFGGKNLSGRVWFRDFDGDFIDHNIIFEGPDSTANNLAPTTGYLDGIEVITGDVNMNHPHCFGSVVRCIVMNGGSAGITNQEGDSTVAILDIENTGGVFFGTNTEYDSNSYCPGCEMYIIGPKAGSTLTLDGGYINGTAADFTDFVHYLCTTGPDIPGIAAIPCHLPAGGYINEQTNTVIPRAQQGIWNGRPYVSGPDGTPVPFAPWSGTDANIKLSQFSYQMGGYKWYLNQATGGFSNTWMPWTYSYLQGDGTEELDETPPLDETMLNNRGYKRFFISPEIPTTGTGYLTGYLGVGGNACQHLTAGVCDQIAAYKAWWYGSPVMVSGLMDGMQFNWDYSAVTNPFTGGEVGMNLPADVAASTFTSPVYSVKALGAPNAIANLSGTAGGSLPVETRNYAYQVIGGGTVGNPGHSTFGTVATVTTTSTFKTVNVSTATQYHNIQGYNVCVNAPSVNGGVGYWLLTPNGIGEPGGGQFTDNGTVTPVTQCVNADTTVAPITYQVAQYVARQLTSNVASANLYFTPGGQTSFDLDAHIGCDAVLAASSGNLNISYQDSANQNQNINIPVNCATAGFSPTNFQSFSATGCVIAATNEYLVCDVTVNIPEAYTNTNYKAYCMGIGPTDTGNSTTARAVVNGVTTKNSGSQFTVQIGTLGTSPGNVGFSSLDCFTTAGNTSGFSNAYAQPIDIYPGTGITRTVTVSGGATVDVAVTLSQRTQN